MRVSTARTPWAAASFLLGILSAEPSAYGQACDNLTAATASRVSAALRAGAPPWARATLTARDITALDAGSFRSMTYLLGYATLRVERLGQQGAPPFVATVVIRCRDGNVSRVADPLRWATERARELHLQLTRAEQAADFAAEVLGLFGSPRPTGASGRRDSDGAYTVTVALAPGPGDSSAGPRSRVLTVTRDGTITDRSP